MRVCRRARRRSLQAVRADHRDGDGVLGVPRAALHAGAVREPAQAERCTTKPQPGLPRVQPQFYGRIDAATYVATSAARCAHAPRWMIVFAAWRCCAASCSGGCRQLPAGGRPGLRVGDRAAAAGRDAAAHRRGVRAGARRREAGRLRRHVAGRRASASSARARTSAWPSSSSSPGTSARITADANSSGANIRRAVPDPRRADLRDQPADGERARPVRRLRHVPAGPQRRRAREALARRDGHAARQGRPEQGAGAACARTRWRTRRSCSSTSTACRRRRWACRSATSTARSS